MRARYPVVSALLLAAILLLSSMSNAALAAVDKTTSKNPRMAVKHAAGVHAPAKASKAASSAAAVSYAGMVVTDACRCVKVHSRDGKSGPVYVQVCEGDGSNWM